MDKATALRVILEQASRGELVFPANASASMKIQQALEDPYSTIETAARWVMTDPLLAARVVAVANSVAYNRFGGSVTNIRTAVTILGFSTLRSLAAAVVVRQMGMSVQDPEVRARMHTLWMHTAQVAALTFLLARKVSHVDPETAVFAGLVHEVGHFYLLSRSDAFPALRTLGSGPDTGLAPEEAMQVGLAVMRKLLVPPRVISAVEALWHPDTPLPPTTLGGTLVLADRLADIASPLDPRDAATHAQDAALDFPLEHSSLQGILRDSSIELQSLMDALLS